MAWFKLPAVYLDDVRMDTSAGLVTGNRDPYPGEDDVPQTANVTVDLMASDGGVAAAATQVYVDGVLAYDGGGSGFQPGFDGVDAATANPDANTLRVVVDPTTPFLSEAVVEVRVVSQSASGAYSVDETYTFQVEDLTPPAVVTAQARELGRVRVQFAEDVRQVDPAAGDDALNPDNYAIARQTTPAVAVAVSEVETVDGETVDLILDIDATPGATYAVTVTGVEDTSGIAVAGPTNTHEFVGFTPPAPAGRAFSLWEKVPQKNRREDYSGDLRAFLAVLQEPIDLLLADSDRFAGILDPHTAPEPFLSRMLEGLGNPFALAEELDEIDKRRLIDVLVEMYRQKGTIPGIKNAVRFFVGVEVEVTSYLAEGWTLGEDELGDTTILAPSQAYGRYAFQVEAPRTLTAEERDRIEFLASYMKCAHEHLAAVTEPQTPTTFDHLELGVSELGESWELH